MDRMMDDFFDSGEDEDGAWVSASICRWSSLKVGITHVPRIKQYGTHLSVRFFSCRFMQSYVPLTPASASIYRAGNG